MSAEKDRSTDGVGDEVWGAIAAFEQILEAMPADTASLAALAHAYGQIGDIAKSVDYMLRLGDTLLSEGEFESALPLVEKLEPHQADARVQRLIERIRTLAQPGAAAAPGAPAIDVDALSSFKIAEELSLAWTLLESKELSQDEYASVVQDLSEMSAADDDATVSVLHVLEARGAKNLDRILGFLAREGGAPFVSLGGYEFQHTTCMLLPLPFVVHRGAVIFELIGGEGLVAVLNPYDRQLRKDVETLAARNCHFYLALPSEFDQLVGRYRETLAHTGEAEA